MTQSPIEPPNNSDQSVDEQSTTRPPQPLTLEEKVGTIVIFLSIGSILLWSFMKGDLNVFIGDSSSSSSPISLIGSTSPSSDNQDTLDNNIDDNDDNTTEAIAPLITAPELPVESTETITDESFSAKSLASLGEKDRNIALESASATEEQKPSATDAVTSETAQTQPPSTTETKDTSAEESPEESAEESPEKSEKSQVVPSAAAKAEPKEPVKFTDVPPGHWAKSYIDALSSRGLMLGYENGEFQPDEPITRAQIAGVVAKTFDLTVDQETLKFSDVQPDYWARESIGKVVQGGFMKGFPDDTFQPNTLVTRTQALTTLVTGLGVEPPSNIQAALDLYTDAGEVPEWATDKIAAATAGRFVVNYPQVSELNPDQATTRAELAAMIYQALARENIVEPVETEYVVGEP